MSSQLTSCLFCSSKEEGPCCLTGPPFYGVLLPDWIKLAGIPENVFPLWLYGYLTFILISNDITCSQATRGKEKRNQKEVVFKLFLFLFAPCNFVPSQHSDWTLNLAQFLSVQSNFSDSNSESRRSGKPGLDCFFCFGLLWHIDCTQPSEHSEISGNWI